MHGVTQLMSLQSRGRDVIALVPQHSDFGQVVNIRVAICVHSSKFGWTTSVNFVISLLINIKFAIWWLHQEQQRCITIATEQISEVLATIRKLYLLTGANCYSQYNIYSFIHQVMVASKKKHTYKNIQ